MRSLSFHVLRSLIAQIWSGPPSPRPVGRPPDGRRDMPRRTTCGAVVCPAGVPDPRPYRQRSAERLGANPRARLGLLAHFQRRRLRDRWTVRAFRPGSYGCSTSRMLPELAMMMLFRFLVSLEPIVKRCDSALVPVPSAAPRRGVCGIAYGTSRSSVRTESIREHDSIVTGIGAEHADATSALSDAFPVSEGARPYLCRGRFQRAQKCSWTVHAFPAEPYGRSLSSML